MSKEKFRFIGDHPEDLASGQVLAPGQHVTLSKDEVADDHNARLIADGKLIGVGEKSAKTAEKTAAKVEREDAKEGEAE